MTFFARGGRRLLDRFRNGDLVVLEEVYRAHVDMVIRAVVRTLRRYPDAGAGRNWRVVAHDLPDLVQEVFRRAFEPETRRRFDGVRDYAPYLAHIARNVVVDHLRRERRQMSLESVELVTEISSQPGHDGADDDFADHETVAVVKVYLASLPSTLQRVHQAMYVDGMSQREAAAALGLGRQVVRTLEVRLREGLRDALGRQQGGLPPPRTVPGLAAVGDKEAS